jgi:hypothetical protein
MREKCLWREISVLDEEEMKKVQMLRSLIRWWNVDWLGMKVVGILEKTSRWQISKLTLEMIWITWNFETSISIFRLTKTFRSISFVYQSAVHIFCPFFSTLHHHARLQHLNFYTKFNRNLKACANFQAFNFHFIMSVCLPAFFPSSNLPISIPFQLSSSKKRQRSPKKLH